MLTSNENICTACLYKEPRADSFAWSRWSTWLAAARTGLRQRPCSLPVCWRLPSPGRRANSESSPVVLQEAAQVLSLGSSITWQPGSRLEGTLGVSSWSPFPIVGPTEVTSEIKPLHDFQFAEPHCRACEFDVRAPHTADVATPRFGKDLSQRRRSPPRTQTPSRAPRASPSGHRSTGPRAELEMS